MIQNERIVKLNQNAIKRGDFVLYWMQASQRTEFNHALEFSISKANELAKPIIVYFGLTDTYPEANQRHYYFMLEGLKEVKQSLQNRGIKFIVQYSPPDEGAIQLAGNAAMVVVDRGYLHIQKKWRENVAKSIKCPLYQIETDVVVPVETTSDKEEFAARTIRPKILRHLDHFLVPTVELKPKIQSLHLDLVSIEIEDTTTAIAGLNIDNSVKRVDSFKGGTSQAKQHLHDFLNTKLKNYSDFRNDPTINYLSNMSPYLHFGQISPLFIALEVMKKSGGNSETYLEELIVRRELSMNYVHFNRNYDTYEGLPDWAKKTLDEHKNELREYLYNLQEWENAKTHDPYWNAAQMEMVVTGKMHGYIRMYWGKKILEWSKTPEEAFKTALYLNNKYELDGRDANGFTGVAWCFGKHDRPWAERPVFGKIRYMNANGLKRKFDADGYVKKIEKLVSGKKN